jgi:hypothetical protein
MKNWLANLVLKAEIAVTQLPAANREYHRKRVAERIKRLQKNSNPITLHITKPEQ